MCVCVCVCVFCLLLPRDIEVRSIALCVLPVTAKGFRG